MKTVSNNNAEHADSVETAVLSRPSPERLALSAKEVARLLGVSRAHLWNLHSSGRLPQPIRLGRVVRWNLKEIEAWLAAGAPARERWEAMRSTN